jgi:hypothetical protein
MEGVPLRDGDDAMTVNWLEIAIADAKGNVTYQPNGAQPEYSWSCNPRVSAAAYPPSPQGWLDFVQEFKPLRP